MTCSHCRHENPTDAKFCNACGAKLDASCPQCGRTNPPGSRFCNECGTSLVSKAKVKKQRAKVKSSSAQPWHPGPNAQHPISYTPSHLAERIQAEREAMEARGAADGERKSITALFADIKGSTDLIADLDPEEARAILDPTLKLMMDAVHRYEGYVAQSLGDGIFALFGAPIAHEDHPQHALYAALLMQEENRKRAEHLRREKGVNVQLRVGINTGEMVLRSIRKDDLHTDYVPVGQSTNLASRMESLATPGSILVSEQTYKLTEGYFEFKALGQAQVKGFAEPLNIYEVAGVGPLRTKLQLSVRRGLARFVGRQSELEQLRRAFESVKAGHGQIAGVMGEPGVGKSRLFYEFKLLCQRGCLVLETFSVSHGKAYPYLPLIDLLKNYFQLTNQNDERQRREKITGKVLTLDRSLEDTLPYLFYLLGLAEPTSPLHQMDGQIRRKRILEAIKRLLLRESLNQPLLLIFEDLHWLDAETQAFLQLLSESIATVRILLLVNYRPEYQASWHDKTYFSQLRLDPLGKDQAEEMLTALLGDASESPLPRGERARERVSNESLEPLKQFILAKTEGNPFFMEEIVQELREQGILTVGAERRIGPQAPGVHIGASLHLPTTVQGVLTARIDRLSAEEKALLQTLAVIGREFSSSLLHKVVTQPEDELHKLLARLQAGEFVYEQPAFPEVEYIFKHALTQEVAYNSLLIERRRVLHERTAQAIEDVYQARLDDHYSELAYHYSRSGNTQKAVDYLYLAGQQAVQRSANEEAITHLTAALELLKTLSKTPKRAEGELSVLLLRAVPLIATQGYSSPEVKNSYERARELCEQVTDTSQLFRALWGMALFYTNTGENRVANQLMKKCMELAEQQQNPSLLLQAHFFTGALLHWFGELSAAQTHLRQAVEFYEFERDHSLAFLCGVDPGMASLAYGSLNLWYLGYPDQALQQAYEAESLAERVSHPLSQCFAQSYIALIHFLRGETQVAHRQTGELARSAEEHLFQHYRYMAMLFHGITLVEQGSIEEGERLALTASTALGQVGSPGGRPVILSFLAEVCRKVGRLEEGLHFVNRGLHVASSGEDMQSEAELHRLKGELTLQEFNVQGSKFQVTDPRPLTPNPQTEAEACFLQAIEIARKQQAKSLELRATVSLARLWQQQGKQHEAHTTLSEIYNWFTEGFDTKDLQEAKALIEELSH